MKWKKSGLQCLVLILDFILMDDESESVRERLSLISINGFIGFILILITLFIFLSFQADCG